MDPHTNWLQRAVLLAIARSLLATAVVVAVIVAPVLATRTEIGIAHSVAWAILAGQAAAGARLGAALVTNPLNIRYLRRHLAAPCAFVPVAEAVDRPDDQSVPTPPSARDRVVIRESTRDTPFHVELVQSGDRQITMAVGRESGSVTLISRLDDGRILCTTQLLVIPRTELVVRVVPGGGSEEIADAHRDALDALRWCGVRPVPTGTGVFVRLLHVEQEAYADLGAMTGALLDIDGTSSILGLRHAPDPDEVFRLGLAASPQPDRRTGHLQRSA